MDNKPDSVPSSGPLYKDFVEHKILNFLQSLPSCPECGHTHFDRFITNYTFPRFPNGNDFDETDPDIELIYADSSKEMIWWTDITSEKDTNL